MANEKRILYYLGSSLKKLAELKDRKKRFRTWLAVNENWRLFDFWIKMSTLIVVALGIWFGASKVNDLLDIRARSFVMVDDSGQPFFEISKNGATTTLDFVVGSIGEAGSKKACFKAMSSSGKFAYFYFNGPNQITNDRSCEDTGSDTTTTVQFGQ